MSTSAGITDHMMAPIQRLLSGGAEWKKFIADGIKSKVNATLARTITGHTLARCWKAGAMARSQPTNINSDPTNAAGGSGGSGRGVAALEAL